MQIAAAQPDIPWTDLAYSLHAERPHARLRRRRPVPRSAAAIGVVKQSFVAGLYGLGAATSNYAPPGTDPDADLTQWYAAINAGEPYDQNPLSQDIADEITRHHSSYYIDDSTAPAPMLISNGWTDDLFPPDEAIRFYNRTRTNHPGHADRAHLQRPRPPARAEQGAGRHLPQPGASRLARLLREGHRVAAVPRRADPDADLRRTVGRRDRRLRRPEHRPAVPGVELGGARAGRGADRERGGADRSCLPCRPTRPVGQAFDPISGSGACATASGADQTGAATYRSDPAPAGGFTLMGSADDHRRHRLARAPPRSSRRACSTSIR